MSRRVRDLSLLLACALLSLVQGASWAAPATDTVAADRIRAAYILKFLEYVEWPETLFADTAAPYVIGVTGSGYVADELARLAPTRTSGGRSILIRRIAAAGAPPELHALYVGRQDRGSGARLARAYAGKPVLVITDDETAVPEASVINFVSIDGRVRFEISIVNADKAGLKLSSRLLAVAVRVYKGERAGDTDVASAAGRLPPYRPAGLAPRAPNPHG